MLYKRIKYSIFPKKVDECLDYLNNKILPIHIKNGAELIGQWVNEKKTEVISIWKYPNEVEYLKIEKRVRKDEVKEKLLKENVDDLFVLNEEEFLVSTGKYDSPKHTVTVSGYITNEKQQTLLVRTYWRDDTWELPGGGVDEGETLDSALCREIYEETGVQVKLLGVTGVYSNGSTIAVVFRGEYTGGEMATSSETKDVRFVKLSESNYNEYITRPKFKPRVLDAMVGKSVPYEAFKVRPYELLNRINSIEDKS